MEKMISFKRLEVTGTTKEEALANAPFGIQGDATQAYRNARKAHAGAWTDYDMKAFMLDYLAKKSKNLPGVGFSITKESAVADTRERPWKFIDHKNEKGTRKYKTFYEVYENLGTDAEPIKGKFLGKVETNKSESKDLGKELFEKGYKNKLVCFYTKQVSEGEPIAWTAEYTPSKSSRMGTYIVFGIENN